VAEDFVLTQMLAASAKKLQGTIHDPTPPPAPAAITLRQLGQRWEAAQDEDVSSGHKRNVRDYLRLHLPTLLDVPIDQIGLEQILEVVKTYRATHAVASTNGLRRTINLLFGFARKARLITEIKFDPLGKKKEPTKHRVEFNEDLLGQLMESVRKAKHPHIPLMITIILGTGVRRSDILAMAWKDVDLDQASWSPYIIKDKAPLFFTLHPCVIEELRRFERLGPYVFSTPAGTRHPDEFLRRALSKAGRAIGVGKLATHALRSAFITSLADQGVPLATIAELVGHSDVRLTMSYLVHTRHSLDEGMRAAQRLASTAVARLAPEARVSSTSATRGEGQ
jgi:integrase